MVAVEKRKLLLLLRQKNNLRRLRQHPHLSLSLNLSPRLNLLRKKGINLRKNLRRRRETFFREQKIKSLVVVRKATLARLGSRTNSKSKLCSTSVGRSRLRLKM